MREESGVALIKNLTGKPVFQAVDPTLLRTKDEWRMIENKVEGIYEKYILCYFLGNNRNSREFANRLSKKTNIPIITLPYMGGIFTKIDYRFGDKQLYDIGPAEFIYLIHHAEYVCTDSYHGTIFSIIFEKEFFCFRRFYEEKTKSLNLRIDSLLKTLKIDGRIIEEDFNLNFDQLIHTKIDYLTVDIHLSRKRRESNKYLSDSLSLAVNKLSEMYDS